MFAKKEIEKLDILFEKYHGMTTFDFSFRIGYIEDELCIEEFDNKYIVYNAKNNNKEDLKIHSTIYDACIDIIKRNAPDEELEVQLINEYNLIILDKKEKELRKSKYYLWS